MKVISFFVPGKNVPQGSKRSWYNPKTERVMMREASPEHASRRHEVWAASLVAAQTQGLWSEDGTLTTEGGPVPLTGPIRVRLTFHQLRNSGHYGTGKHEREVKASSPAYPTVAPDIDKLTRLVLDSMTQVIFVDDAQVVKLAASKVWADRFTGMAGVLIEVGEVLP